VQTTKFKDVLKFLGQISILMATGRSRKFSRNGVLQKGTPSLLEIRLCLGEQDEFISKTAQAQIKAALAKKRTRPFTAIPVSVTPFLGMTVRTATRPRRRRLTGVTSEFLKQKLL
jgi:hypothetical protein